MCDQVWCCLQSIPFSAHTRSSETSVGHSHLAVSLEAPLPLLPSRCPSFAVRCWGCSGGLSAPSLLKLALPAESSAKRKINPGTEASHFPSVLLPQQRYREALSVSPMSAYGGYLCTISSLIRQLEALLGFSPHAFLEIRTKKRRAFPFIGSQSGSRISSSDFISISPLLV